VNFIKKIAASSKPILGEATKNFSLFKPKA
jgi:hypothetical protein